jgi:acetyltransferase-like isoleucine patch superfamily enzyme
VRERVRFPVDGPAFSGARLDVARPGSVTTGPASYLGEGSVIKTWADTERIELGAYCSLSDDVRLLVPGGDELFDADGRPLQLVRRGVHRPTAASTFPIGGLVPYATFDEPPPGAQGRPLVIGDDVWIGYGATVIGGLTIGTGAIVGTGSLVRRDVAPYEVVAGNPARVVRKRFADDVCERLLRIGWWDWPDELVRANWRWFTLPAERFVEHFDPAGGPASPD